MRQKTLRAALIIGVIFGIALAAVSTPSIQIGGFKRAGNGPFGLTLGLDLRGGAHLVYQSADPNVSADDMKSAVATIERRVNGLGVAEASVQQLGADRIVVQLPGQQNVEQAKNLIGKTAQMEVKERTCTKTLQEDPGCTAYEDVGIGLSGADLSSASLGTNQTTGQPIVNMQWNSHGTTIFADLTRRIAGNERKRIAFILDGQTITDPTARAVIPDGSGFIEGNFTVDQARELAIQLNSGRLAVPLTLIQESTVDAVLGEDSLNASVKAGIVGICLVVVFMLAYYRMAGVVAALALFMYAVLSIAIFKLIPITLTLPGMAGFVLSIGMAVDANVLIFERMKEELRTGRSLISAADAGFQRAWTSIRDSNVSTFITCAILYWFGSRTGAGLIQGFALTLFIGTAASMFTAITVSRTLMQLVVLFTPIGKITQLFTPEPLARPSASKPAAGEAR